MDNMDFRARIYGEAYIEKEKRFNAKLAELDAKYKYWLEQQPPKYAGQDHPTIQDYFILSYNGEVYNFGITKNADLPHNIEADLVNAFKEVYSTD